MPAGEAFSGDQRVRLDDAVRATEAQTGMRYVVFIGELPAHSEADLTAFVEGELTRLRHLGPELVLVALGPGQRLLRVATSAQARDRLTDQACSLAALSMTTSFAVGDLVGGLAVGLRMLADATVHAPLDHGRPESTSSTVTP